MYSCLHFLSNVVDVLLCFTNKHPTPQLKESISASIPGYTERKGVTGSTKKEQTAYVIYIRMARERPNL